MGNLGQWPWDKDLRSWRNCDLLLASDIPVQTCFFENGCCPNTNDTKEGLAACSLVVP